VQQSVRTPAHIPPSAHQISLSAVSKPAIKIVKQLNDAGYEAYLVGGCVRDLLLHHIPKDFDVATNAYPEQVKAVFRRARLIGRRFRLAHVRMGRDVVEVATFRAGVDWEGGTEDEDRHINEDGQILRDNVYGGIEDDAFRRDFTINALYYDPNTQTVVDYVDGTTHLQERRLVAIGDPQIRFREDPVRMLRALRFSVKLGFDLDPEMASAIRSSADALRNVPPSRMLDEMLKLFHNGYALEVYRQLKSTRLFERLFPFSGAACAAPGSGDLIELALANTDTRIREGKPVIPAFLFSALLWHPLQEQAEVRRRKGMPPRSALSTAAFDILAEQSAYVGIPKRIGTVVREIWQLQQRLERRLPRGIKTLMRHQRFRAAYDFLLLRAELGEVDQALADWWTRIQEVDQGTQHEMIKALEPPPQRGRRRKRRRRRHS
jgi:poly(A) polymerase